MGAPRMTEHQAYQQTILEIIRSQVGDKSKDCGLLTPIDEVDIDSMGIIEAVFKVEEEFGTSVELVFGASYATVGDLVEALVKAILTAKSATS